MELLHRVSVRPLHELCWGVYYLLFHLLQVPEAWCAARTPGQDTNIDLVDKMNPKLKFSYVYEHY